MRLMLTAILLGITSATPTASIAATWHVPGDAPTIQAGVDSAAAGDTVLVAPGEYSGPGNRNIRFNGRDLTVRSESGPEQTTIRVEGSAENPGQAFRLELGETDQSSIRGFTIRGGYHTYGGGIYVVSSPTSPLIRDCIFIGNRATRYGGAVWAGEDYNTTIENCTFIENWAGINGGAVAYGAVVTHSTFTGNTAENQGGALSGILWVSGCTFSDNAAPLGSAICLWAGPGTTIAESTFIRNTGSAAVVKLGATDMQAASIQSCTFHGNQSSAGTEGTGGLVIEKSILSFGAEESVDISPAGSADLSCVDIYGNGGGDWVGRIADQLGMRGNISEDPLFCGASESDLHLHAASPCAPASAGACSLIGALGVACNVTLHVPDPYPTIQVAVDAAFPGDTVMVAAGTYTGVGNRNINFGGRDIRLVSMDGAETTIIDCENQDRAFVFSNRESRGASIRGFTIRNGSRSGTSFPSGYGGAMLFQHDGGPAGATVIECVFSNNRATMDGGAVCIDAGNPRFVNCEFHSNQTDDPGDGDGGAIKCQNSALELDGCVFTGNVSARWGGALYIHNQITTPDTVRVRIAHSEFTSNRSADDGGAVALAEHGYAMITQSIFARNQAAGSGGAIAMIEHVDMGNAASLVDCAFSNNIALGRGGAIYCSSSPTGGLASLGVFDCTFADNLAEEWGGAMFCSTNFAVELNHCLLAGNAAAAGGGGLYAARGKLTISNTTIHRNAIWEDDRRGGGLWLEMSAGNGDIFDLRNVIVDSSTSGEGVHCEGADVPAFSCFDICGNAGGDWIGSIADQLGDRGNISSDPRYCDAANGEFSLSANSPCAPGNSPSGCGLIGAYAVGCSAAPPVTLRVPADHATIQAAVSAAAAWDTVLVAPGTYSGDGNRDIHFEGKEMVLRSEGGAGTTVIDAKGGDGDYHRGFSIRDGEGRGLVIEGFTVRGGYVDSTGGGVKLSGSSPTMSNCVFEDNFAALDGGAVGALSAGGAMAYPLFNGCVFRKNRAGSSGGAAFVTPGDGGLWATFRTCAFDSNFATNGGATAHEAVIENCVFVGNEVSGLGGALFQPVNVTGSRFERNVAMEGGAAVWMSGDLPGTVIDHGVFLENDGSVVAGGAATEGIRGVLRSCTFYGNDVGVFLAEQYGLDVENCIIGYGREAVEVSGAGPNISFSCTDIFGNAGGDWTGAIADQLPLRENLHADPVFCAPEQGDLRVSSISPCLDSNASECGLIGALGQGCAHYPPILIISPGVAALGGAFDLGIQVGTPRVPVDSLFGLTFEVHFTNPGLVEVLDVSCADRDRQPLGMGEDVICFGNIDSEAGVVSCGVTRLEGAAGVGGSPLVLRIEFGLGAVASPGDSTAITLKEIAAVDPGGQPIQLEGMAEPIIVQVVDGCVVWAGDTNNDAIVDERDILPLGRHWRRTGANRDAPGCTWGAQVVDCWDPVAATHADANGDGEVDVQDILCLGLNWHRSHLVPGGRRGPAPVSEAGFGNPAFNVDAFVEMLAYLEATSEGGTGVEELKSALEQLIRAGGQRAVPSVASVAQNVPNPFNPSTRIVVGVPTRTRVTLAIYDIGGRHVRTLIDDLTSAGYYNILWDGRNDKGHRVSSAVYFCRAEIGEQVFVRRMTLVR